MTDETKNIIISSGRKLTATAVDAIISAIVLISPFQLGGAIKAGYSEIRDAIFNEKLESFLNSTKKLTEEDKQTFLKKINKEKETFFKRLFNTLDRMDEKYKCAVLGKIFSSLLKELISINDFRLLSSVIENVWVDDLHFFEQKMTQPTMTLPIGRTDSDTINRLLNSGLILSHTKTNSAIKKDRYSFDDNAKYVHQETKTEIAKTEAGQKLWSIMNDSSIPDRYCR